MSDKHLREKALKSDRKMRSTPIAESYFRFYHKKDSKEIGQFKMMDRREKRADERFASDHGQYFV